MKKCLKIKGMSCEHCKARVESALNALDGVTANVDLKAGKAVIHMEQEIPEETLLDTVNALGYVATVSRSLFGR